MFDSPAFIAEINSKLSFFDLSLRGAAVQIGVSASTLSRVTNGNPPDLVTLESICKWLGVPADKFFVDAPSVPKPIYPALDDATVRELIECGVDARMLAGLNRYVQTILDERDKFYDALTVTFERMSKWAALLEDSEKADNIVSDIDAHLSEYSLDKFNYLSED